MWSNIFSSLRNPSCAGKRGQKNILTTVNNVQKNDTNPNAATKLWMRVCSSSVKMGFWHWMPHPSMPSYQLDWCSVSTSGGRQGPSLNFTFLTCWWKIRLAVGYSYNSRELGKHSAQCVTTLIYPCRQYGELILYTCLLYIHQAGETLSIGDAVDSERYYPVGQYNPVKSVNWAIPLPFSGADREIRGLGIVWSVWNE